MKNTNSLNRGGEKFYLDHPIEANCDEDGETFICYGTKSKLKAFQAIKDFADSECGLDEECLPKMADLEISKLWYGLNKDEGEDWYWWGNPPRGAKYLGLCWKYEVISHD